ncbi:MAG TPA: PfkB family carbohydrate kinase, partial [Deinococcales bacterium]|nr:PfkB family carbohydrate kinase [Deinococcales bacterium]
ALPPDVLADVNVLVVNEHELAVVSGLENAPVEEAARGLLGRGPNTVVVTLGSRGCLAVTAAGDQRLPAFPVNVVDTTGAGDTFTGVLATWLDEGQPLAESLRAASAAAALSCTAPGAQGGMPTRAQIETLTGGQA